MTDTVVSLGDIKTRHTDLKEYMPATILGSRDIKMNKIQYLLLRNLWSIWKRQTGKQNK